MKRAFENVILIIVGLGIISFVSVWFKRQEVNPASLTSSIQEGGRASISHPVSKSPNFGKKTILQEAKPQGNASLGILAPNTSTQTNLSSGENPAHQKSMEQAPLRPVTPKSPDRQIHFVLANDDCVAREPEFDENLQRYSLVDFNLLSPEILARLSKKLRMGGPQSQGEMATGESLLRVISSVSRLKIQIGGNFDQNSNVAIDTGEGCVTVRKVLSFIASGTNSKWGVSASGDDFSIFFK